MMMRDAAASPALGVLVAGLVTLAGCSPALDWREIRPEGSGVTMLFPCRPDRHERQVRLDDRTVRMQMHSCSASDATFSLGVIEASGPGEVTPMLAALRAGASANLAADGPVPLPIAVAGMTPNPESALLRIAGHLPDGRPVSLHAAFFVKGMRLYQASAIGKVIPANASDTFFEAIRISP